MPDAEASTLAFRAHNPLGEFNLIDLKKIEMGFYQAVGVLVLMVSCVISGVTLLLAMRTDLPAFREQYLTTFVSAIHMVVWSSILLVLSAIHEEMISND